MDNQFDELTKSLAQSVTRRAVLKKFSVGLAGMAVAVSLSMTIRAATPSATTSTVVDVAGDAVFPYDLYDAPVPPYLDVVKASVSLKRGVFHFEIQMNGEISDDADPGFTPSVNHLGPTFGILTGPKKNAEKFKFLGQPDTYHFNFLVGALYSVSDNGLGLDLGWTAFLIDLNTFTAVEIPLHIRGDKLVFETSAASLCNPSSFDWAVVTECDPVPVPDEKRKSTLLVDYAPNHGYATWPAQQPES